MRGLAKVARTEGAMELIKRDRPQLEPNEALVEVENAGLCGSDAGIYQFKSEFERMELPTVIGHEYTGHVVETGEQVSKFSTGDRVVERPIRPCHNCYQCEVGQENVCQSPGLTGIDHNGAFEQYIAVPVDSLHPVPDELQSKYAAVVEPTAIATRAVIRHSRVSPGDRVLVQGPGPIGLLTAQVAQAQGGNVIVSGVARDAEYRLPLAEELGFEVVDISKDDLSNRSSTFTSGNGYDVIFDTTGHPSGLTTAANEIRKGGQVVLVGQSGTASLDYSSLVRAEVDLQCSYSAVYEDFERALRVILSEDVDAETFIDDRFSLLDADNAFQAFISGKTVKPVFDVSELYA